MKNKSARLSLNEKENIPPIQMKKQKNNQKQKEGKQMQALKAAEESKEYEVEEELVADEWEDASPSLNKNMMVVR